MIRSSPSTILLKFGNKSALEENDEPELKGGPRRSQSRLRSLGELKVSSRRLRTLTGIEGVIKAFEDIDWN